MSREFETDYVIDELAVFAARLEDAMREAERGVAARAKRNWRVSFAVACASAVLAVVVLFSGVIGQGGTSVGVSEALAGLADRLEIAPQPDPSQFEYTKTRFGDAIAEPAGLDMMGKPHEAFVFTQPTWYESWLSVTRDGAGRGERGEPIFPTERDAERGRPVFAAADEYLRLTKTPEGRKRLHSVNAKRFAYFKNHPINSMISPTDAPEESRFIVDGKFSLGGESLTPEQLAKYPRDPWKVYLRVRSQIIATNEKFKKYLEENEPGRAERELAEIPSVEQQMWDLFTGGASIQGQLVPTDLRAAMLRALAFVPGVEAAGAANGPHGRDGLKFTREADGRRYEVIFDKETGVLLKSDSYLTDAEATEVPGFAHLPVGTRLSFYELIEKKTLDNSPRVASRGDR